MENLPEENHKINEKIEKDDIVNNDEDNRTNKDEQNKKIEEKNEIEIKEEIQQKINDENNNILEERESKIEVINIEKEENVNNNKKENKIEKNGNINIINEEKEENNDKNKIELKDDNISENTNSIKDDVSNISNSNSNRNLSILRLNSEIDLDKIIAGKDESQMNITNNDNIEEYKIEQKNSEEEEEIEEENPNENCYYLGNIFRDVVNKRKNENEIYARPTIYDDKILGEENQNINFGEIINAQINEIKEKTMSYFEKTMKELDKRYNDYINKMAKYINENEKKILKVFQNDIKNDDNLLEFADNNIFKQVDNVLEVHENIFNAIEDHIGLLKAFLGQTNLISQKNPLEHFINNNSYDILKSWFLNKINFQKLNFSKVIVNKDLSELCTRYLCKKKENNFSFITIKKDNKGNISLESEFVKEHLNNLEKLKFLSLNNEEINSLFINQKKEENEGKDNKEENIPSADKLTSLSIIDSDFSSSNLTKVFIPELKKLKIKKTPLIIYDKNFFESILGNALFLQKLYLQKCYLDDQSLSKIFEFLSEKQQMIESLQKISLSGNEITSFDMKIIIDKNCIFKSLQYLDLSKNNIYEFLTDNYKFLTKINVLDLTDNNISNYLFFKVVKSQKKEQSITLLCNNIFINNNKSTANKYSQYLSDTLIKFRYKIKKLNLSFLYNKNTINQLVELKISPMVKISLIKLNLSYCGLKNENICGFLKNNFGLLNLEEFNLSNNLITIKIFNMILKIDTSFEKLKSLDLSMNKINSLSIDEYSELEKFVNKHSVLKKIKFQESTFCQDLLLLTQLEKERCEEINKKLIEREIKFIVEKDYNILIVPLKQLFELKDKDVL